MRLVYAGEDGTTTRANKETRWGNLAPRIGVAWDVTGDAKNVVRAGYGKSYFPVPHAAGNLLDQNVPDSISQNYSVETNPLVYTPDRVPPLSSPFPAIVPVKPQGTAELNAANPLVFGHAFSNETPHMHTWQVSYERQITNTLMAEVAYVGSKGKNLIWVGNINEVQPGPGSQASRRLIQPLSNVATINYFDPSNSSSYNSLQAKLVKRFSHGLQFLTSYTFGKSLDYAGAPASGGGAVGGPQSVTLFDESHGPSGFDVKHRFVLSWVWALPFGEGHAHRRRRDPEADPGELAVQRHRHALDRPAVHRVPQHRRQQRRPVLAEPDRRRAARQPHGRPVVRPHRLRGAARQHLRELGSRGAVRAWHADDRRLALAQLPDQGLPPAVPGRRLQPVQHPAVWLPEREHRLPDRGPHHQHHRRQPLDAVRAEARLVIPIPGRGVLTASPGTRLSPAAPTRGLLVALAFSGRCRSNSKEVA